MGWPACGGRFERMRTSTRIPIWERWAESLWPRGWTSVRCPYTWHFSRVAALEPQFYGR